MAEQQQKQKKRGPPTFTLPNKKQISLVGFGTYKLQSEQVITPLLRKALQVGIRHIDTARYYNNQIALGSSIQKLISQNRCNRSDLFIATKTFPHKNLNPILELKQSLSLMKLKYVDLYYIHWPFIGLDSDGKTWSHVRLEDYWTLMEECVRKGYAKYLGVSNFNGQLIADLLTFCKIKPIICQIQTHPYLPQQSLIQYCQKNGITVIAHTPLVRAQSCTKQDVNIMKEQLITDIASKYGKSPAQVVLKFNLIRGVGVIPKTSNPNRLSQNYQSWTCDLTDDELKKLKNLPKTVRVCDGKYYLKNFTPFD